MNDFVCCPNRAGQTIGWCRHCGINRADQRQISVPGCFGQMRVNRFDREGAGNLACIAAAHAVTDDIESEWRVGHEAILVMRSFKADIGFGAMQSFEGQTTPPSSCETLQTSTEFACEFFRAPITVRQLFL